MRIPSSIYSLTVTIAVSPHYQVLPKMIIHILLVVNLLRCVLLEVIEFEISEFLYTYYLGCKIFSKILKFWYFADTPSGVFSLLSMKTARQENLMRLATNFLCLLVV